jgi:hypothetical protein
MTNFNLQSFAVAIRYRVDSHDSQPKDVVLHPSISRRMEVTQHGAMKGEELSDCGLLHIKACKVLVL